MRLANENKIWLANNYANGVNKRIDLVANMDLFSRQSQIKKTRITGCCASSRECSHNILEKTPKKVFSCFFFFKLVLFLCVV